MKKRIEIIAFRRRTTIVLRDRSHAGRTLRSEGDDDAVPQKHDGTVRAAGSDLDQNQTTISDKAEESGHE